MFRFSLVLLFCASITACSARTPIPQVNLDTLRGNTAFDNVYLRDFTTAPEVPNGLGALTTTENFCMDYLRNTNIFKKVDAFEEASTPIQGVVVDVHLKKLRIVSGAARIWVGVWAGRSHMVIDAKIIDAESGAVLAEEELTGVPGAYGSAWSGGAADRDLPKAMGRLLADYILSKSEKNASAGP